MKTKIQLFFLLTLVVNCLIATNVLLLPAVAYAQTPPTNTSTNASTGPQYSGVESSIRKYLCVPGISNPNGTDAATTVVPIAGTSVTGVSATVASSNPDSGDLVVCVNKLYKFGATIGAFAAVFFIVLAGYYYIIGGDTLKRKAKDYIISVIAGLIVIFTSYIFLHQINPAITEFRTIQPQSLVGSFDLPPCNDKSLNLGDGCLEKNANGTATAGSSNGSGGSLANGIINGYNIGAYATAKDHDTLVAKVYASLQSVDVSTADKITAQMKKVASSTPLTGAMVLAASQKNGNTDVKLIMSMMQVDSSYGTAGKGARTHNPGNVGNDDAGNTKDYGTWDAGVSAVAQWLNSHRV